MGELPMKKIVVSAIIWGGLWAAGLFLSAGRGTKVDEWSFFITPMVLATAIVVWGVISAKGGLGTIAGMIIGLCLAVGTFFGFILLSVLVQKELIGEGHMARDIAKLMVGGIIGGIAGACSEMGRQGLLRKE
jgi:hypothetical protein